MDTLMHNVLRRVGALLAVLPLALAASACGTVDDGVAAAVRGLEARLPSMVTVPRDVAEAAFAGCEGLVARGDLVLAVEHTRDEAAVWHGTDVVCVDALEPLAREALRIADERSREGVLPLDLLLQGPDGALYTARWTSAPDGSGTSTPPDDDAEGGDADDGGEGEGDPFPQPSDPDPNAGDPFPQPSDPDPNAGDPFPQPSDPDPTSGDPFPQPSTPNPNTGDPFPQPSDADPTGGDPFPQPSDVKPSDKASSQPPPPPGGQGQTAAAAPASAETSTDGVGQGQGMVTRRGSLAGMTGREDRWSP